MSNIFNISSALPFLPSLAANISARFANLHEVTIFVPTKRSVMLLREEFAKLAAKNGAVILPKIEALGDVDEDEFILQGFPHIEKLPPAISQNERLFKITRMIRDKDGSAVNAYQALQIAFRLCQLLDEFHNRGAEIEALQSIVPADLASHWQQTLDFLEVITKQWSEHKAQHNLLDQVERRNLMLKKVAEYWRDFPPQKPIVIAGTTATIPATQELISSICQSQNGYFFIYGLDRNLRDADLQQLAPTHPQFNLAQLLQHMQLPIEQVAELVPTTQTAKQKLLSTALLPEWRVDEWQQVQKMMQNFELIEAKNQEEEAATITLILREFVEQGQGRATLVSSNASFARNVEQKLQAWNVPCQNLHGTSFDKGDTAQFLLLLAQMFASKQKPSALLAFFKHKFVKPEIATKICQLELQKQKLRGLRPDNFCISEHGFEFANFALTKNLFAQKQTNLYDALAALVALAEEISAKHLWQGEGEKLAEFLFDYDAELKSFGNIDPLLLPQFLEQLFAYQKFFKPVAANANIEILPTIEARFCSSDLLILSGLNEGEFPQVSSTGDLLNQSMRKALGLDLPERRIGQQAHDFELLSQLPRVVFSRAKKAGGAPTVPSRFLQALASLVEFSPQPQYAAWLAKMRSSESVIACEQPKPTPPLAARPMALAVTKIEKLMRDPYMIYAEKILNLRKLDDLDAEVEASDFGNFVHKALEEYSKNYDGKIESMIACAERLLQAEYSSSLTVLKIFWLPRFRKIAQWVFAEDEKARAAGWAVESEIQKKLSIALSCGEFMLDARADRLEISANAVKIIDFKTGMPPSTKNVVKGFAPQISLEALIFSRSFGKKIESLEFWQTKGKDSDSIQIVDTDIEVLIDEAEQGVTKLLQKFADEKTPYIARPRPQVAMEYNDYAHLARIKEWE